MGLVVVRIFSSSAKSPLYQELYQKLREKIESGEYDVGSRLPSEKELAEEYGVSRITSKHALDQLAREGFISRFPGKGSYIQSRSAAPASHAQDIHDEHSRLIGVVIEGIHADFGGDILTGIDQQCADKGYSAVIKFSGGSEEREKACINELLDVGVDGILLMCVYREVYNSTIMKLSLDGYPMIFMDRALNGLPIPYVGTNHYEAAREITGELIRRRHTHLALAMYEDSHTTSSAEDRVHGYVQCCIDNELLCANRRLLLLQEDFHNPGGEIRKENLRRVREFIAGAPDTTAILSLSAEVAAIVLEALADSGRQYAIAAFDGPRTFHADGRHEFVYIFQDQKAIGRTACALLIDRICGRDVPMFTEIPYKMI